MCGVRGPRAGVEECSMRRLRAFATAVLVVSTGSCSPTETLPTSLPAATVPTLRPPSERAPVVLVTIDGSRWQDVYTSPALMPTLHELGREYGALLGGRVG